MDDFLASSRHQRTFHLSCRVRRGGVRRSLLAVTNFAELISSPASARFDYVFCTVAISCASVERSSYEPASHRAPIDFHQDDHKLLPLAPHELSEHDYANKCKKFIDSIVGGDVSGLRVLDVGCGRGDLVYRLRSAGAKAFGVEVEAKYVESGRILQNLYPDDTPILGLIDKDGRFPFPDCYFDYVVSFQVLEHVADLNALASEVARVLRPGGSTVNVFPAKFRPIEPHYHLPFVHWLPKGAFRRTAVGVLLRMGFGRQILKEFDVRSKIVCICDYAERETFYRSPSAAAKPFVAAGLRPHSRAGARAFIVARLGGWPRLAFCAAPFMTIFRTTVVSASKPLS